MQYWHWLVGISLFFLVLERIFPWRKQKLLRKSILTDTIYLVFNAHYLNIAIETVQIFILLKLNDYVKINDYLSIFDIELISGQSFIIQFIILFFTHDFIQWLIHVSLHNIPVLWKFHKIHHTIEELDWIGNFKFHWFEIVVYKSILYFPLAFFGYNSNVLFWFAVFSTAQGHFNHSNLKMSLGPLRYFFNTPVMHVWHHNLLLKKEEKTVNYGINLSIWDWIFNTAYMPKNKHPKKIGIIDKNKIPKSFIRQELYPFIRFKK